MPHKKSATRPAVPASAEVTDQSHGALMHDRFRSWDRRSLTSDSAIYRSKKNGCESDVAGKSDVLVVCQL